MELEEQKPKDIILNEREIKQEAMEFLENVKNEPVDEEDYSKLLVPKQETQELLENFKEEPIDEEHFEEMIPKLEEIMEPSALSAQDAHLTNPVKEEPIEEEDYSELLVPKQETHELFETIKEEPIDEEDYFELIVPEHEKVIEPSACYMSSNPVQKSFTETLEDVPKLDFEPQIKSWERFRCLVCLQSCPRQNMKYVTMDEDKLVTMIGCILNGTYTIDQAQCFMSERRRSSTRVCQVHFSEAINKIYKVLNIKNDVKINSCSSELMNKLMITVNAISPQTETWRFCGTLHNFIRRNNLQNRRCSTNGKHSKMHRKRCPVCTVSESFKYMKYVTVKEDKLVIMVGCILRGDYTHEQAQSFLSQKKMYCLICHVHFSEALDDIHKALNIKHPNEAASVELTTNLMITVNKLCPQFDSWQFRTSLNKFFTRNKRFIQIL